jgi:hypothetical protein
VAGWERTDAEGSTGTDIGEWRLATQHALSDGSGDFLEVNKRKERRDRCWITRGSGTRPYE